jgi:hypothetical protein
MFKLNIFIHNWASYAFDIWIKNIKKIISKTVIMGGWSNLLRSLKNSTDKPVEAVIKGNIPKWLTGSLFR